MAFANFAGWQDGEGGWQIDRPLLQLLGIRFVGGNVGSGVMFSPQAPSAVVMIRPHQFAPNPATAVDNKFQSTPGETSFAKVAAKAFEEVTNAVERLRNAGIFVHLFEDEGSETPDSVFPNNWFSTHAGGHVALYPLFAPNRRSERRSDILEMLKNAYRVHEVVDFSGLEHDGIYLEGTGAMVLDHISRVAYASRSRRADPVMLERFCCRFNFEPMMFDTADEGGAPIYHTNVMMCIGTKFCLIAADAIKASDRRATIEDRLSSSGRRLIHLSVEQMHAFAGNAIELTGTAGPTLAMSTTAFASLTPDQVRMIGSDAMILPIDVPTIELAGGSIRCMVAGIHIPRR